MTVHDVEPGRRAVGAAVSATLVGAGAATAVVGLRAVPDAGAPSSALVPALGALAMTAAGAALLVLGVSLAAAVLAVSTGRVPAVAPGGPARRLAVLVLGAAVLAPATATSAAAAPGEAGRTAAQVSATAPSEPATGPQAADHPTDDHPTDDQSADDPPADDPATAEDPVADALTGGWMPARPPAPAPTADVRLVAPAGRHADAAVEVVVRRGDTLWGLAARSLGPGATDAEVAAAWPRWWDANRDVVGDDPDLLLPGQVLRPPTP